jgi:hypothetical protein
VILAAGKKHRAPKLTLRRSSIGLKIQRTHHENNLFAGAAGGVICMHRHPKKRWAVLN